jgi:hypothetical protein
MRALCERRVTRPHTSRSHTQLCKVSSTGAGDEQAGSPSQAPHGEREHGEAGLLPCGLTFLFPASRLASRRALASNVLIAKSASAAKRAPRLLYWHLPWGATAVPDAACEHSLMTNGQVISVESTRVHCEWLPSRVARNAAPRTHLGRHSPPAQSPRLSAAHQGSSSGWLRLGGLLR